MVLYYSAGVTFKNYERIGNQLIAERPTIILPYDFIDPLNVTNNGFYFVDSQW